MSNVTDSAARDGDGLPIACSLNAFDAAQTARYQSLVALLRAAAPAVTESADGFSYTFTAPDTPLCLAAMEFATLERRCCPFLTFRLELTPAGRSLTLSLSGPEGAKEILAGLLTAR